MRPARPPVPLIIDMSRRRRMVSGPARSYSGGFGCSLLASLALVALTVFATLIYVSVTTDLPSLETIPALLQPPDGLLLKPTQIFDRSGKNILETISYPGAEKRGYISFASDLQRQKERGFSADSQLIPSVLISATLITRDPQFWDHAGYSLEGISQGAHPTLAQALASDLLLWSEPPGFRRALRERILARQITAEYGREQVLEWYLNSAQYGPGIYGAETAAKLYFGVSASKLSLAQAAALVAAAQAPALNPLDAPDANLENQQKIIQMLRERNWISDTTATKARKERLNVLSKNPQMASPNLAFTNLVMEQLSTLIDRARLERGGFRVITSLDYDLQQQAACTARVQLKRLSMTGLANIEGDDPQCQAARLLPTLPSAALHDLDNTYATIVALDPRTGEVLALVGDTAPGQNPAAGIGQPPGTLLAPFIYLTAFTRGFSPASLVWDIPAHLDGLGINHLNGDYQGPMRLRNALANDRLAPLAYTLTQVGPENVWAMTRQIGLFQVDPAAEPANLLDFLMATRLTLLQVSRAFGIFANQGVLAGLKSFPTHPSQGSQYPQDNTNPTTFSNALAPTIILRVEDASGSMIHRSDSPQSRPVISPQLAFLITQVLSDETARWPSLGHPNPLEIGRPAAVKMIQTLDGANAWTIGYLPQLVVGVRIGKGESSETAASSPAIPANAAAGLWHALTQYAARSLPYESWIIPPGISIVDVCESPAMNQRKRTTSTASSKSTGRPTVWQPYSHRLS